MSHFKKSIGQFYYRNTKLQPFFDIIDSFIDSLLNNVREYKKMRDV